MTNTQSKLRAGYELAHGCRLCPRRCGVDRLSGECGACQGGGVPKVASFGAHFGEESVLVGRGGSGTVFLSGCSLGCVFCQNADISHGNEGFDIGVEDVVRIMTRLQQTGCVNINFVTPTHYAPWIADAVIRAREQGLSVPIVYNCGGYESIDMLRLLAGVVDIYMPDVKFADADVSTRLADAPDYFEVVKEALIEMHRQVGDLVITNGLATRGLLVRHLVMPNDTAGTPKVLRFIAERVSPRTFVNIMGQYRPAHHASRFAEIARRPTISEIDEARSLGRRLGLRLDGEIG